MDGLKILDEITVQILRNVDYFKKSNDLLSTHHLFHTHENPGLLIAISREALTKVQLELHK